MNMSADQQAVFDLNRRLIEAIADGRDLTRVMSALDPDPIRYMSVAEGGGLLRRMLGNASALLGRAPALAGHEHHPSTEIAAEVPASSPSVFTDQGHILVVWLRCVPGRGDVVCATLLDKVGKTARTHELTDGCTDCFRPSALIDSRGVPWAFYGRSQAGVVSVYCRRMQSGEWTAEELVSDGTRLAFNQEVIARDDGGVEACWQSRLDGRFAIISRQWHDGRGWLAPMPLSGQAVNAWDPALVAVPDGITMYAWCEYRDGSYQLVIRDRHRSGDLGALRQVTRGTDYALHPSLAATPDGKIWCAYDLVTIQGHGGSGPTRLRDLASIGAGDARLESPGGQFVPPEVSPDIKAAIRVVQLAEDGISEPGGHPGEHLVITPAGLPRLAVDAHGGLTVAYRVMRRLPLLIYYWDIVSQQLGPDGWGGPATYENSDGPLEEPALSSDGARTVIVWQSDSRASLSLGWDEGFGGRERVDLIDHHGAVIWNAPHRDGRLRCHIAEAPPPGLSVRPTVSEPVSYLHSAERREARPWLASTAARYQTNVNGETMTLYWGDLHRHSLISRCTAGDEPSLEDFYRYSTDVTEYDFWAVTDHSENSSDQQWWSIQKIADLYHVKDEFIPLYGFEWTGLKGHHNVIYGDVPRGAPILSSRAHGQSETADLWTHLRRWYDEYPAITIPHHPGCAFVPFDWSRNDSSMVRLVEIFQACRGNYEADGCFRQYADGTDAHAFALDGLRCGYRFGFIASSDHGYGASYVGAYATNLDRRSVFGALRGRRTFGATTKGIVLDFRINDMFMGGELIASGPAVAHVYVRGYRDLSRVDIVRNGDVVHTLAHRTKLPAGWESYPVRIEWGGARGTRDWSGSLAVNGGEILQTEYWSPEITEVEASSVRWQAATYDYGDHYGAQRGGIELTVLGSPDATLSLCAAKTKAEYSLRELRQVRDVAVDQGHLRLQPGTGGLSSLGQDTATFTWTDTFQGSAWYYLRAILVDGEMAWSSPIWVDRVAA